MIYFIKAVDSGNIKIGTSTDPQRRLETMQTGSPERLEMIGVIPGGRTEEQRLHKRFKRFRIHGEWFGGDPDLVYAIKAMLTVPIEELIASMSGSFWRIKGEAVRGANVTQDMDLFCVNRSNTWAKRPEPDEMLSAICVGPIFSRVDFVRGPLAREPKQWPFDLELLRSPLTSTEHLVWVADMMGANQFHPVLPYHLREARMEDLPPHETDSIVKGSVVFHAEDGVGRVTSIEMCGTERAAYINFKSTPGSTRRFLRRVPIRLATPEEAKELEPKPEPSKPWRPKWMDEPPMF